MTGRRIGHNRSKLLQDLQLLSQDEGVWRPDLLELLDGELSDLRALWAIDLDRGLDAARQTIWASIHAYIAQLAPRRSNQPLTPELRDRQYKTVVLAYFNVLPRFHALREMNLTRRREWLAHKERDALKVSKRTSQRDFEHAISQIEDMLTAHASRPTVTADGSSTEGHNDQLAESVVRHRVQEADRSDARDVPHYDADPDSESAATGNAPTNGSSDPWWRRSVNAIAAWSKNDKAKVAAAVGAMVIMSLAAYLVVTVFGGNASNNGVSNGLWSPPPPASVDKPADESMDNTRGWGPDRSIFTMNAPAAEPVFNSITDNPKHGDQRNFVQCRDKEDGAWADELIPKDGHIYTCSALFANSIAPNMEEEKGEDGLLQNSRLRVYLPPANTHNTGVTVALSADNADTVWDSANFISPKRITVTYVRRSAWMTTNHTPEEGLPLDEEYEGSTMSSGIRAGSGALIGSWSQDGRIGQPSGYVVFDVRVELAA